MKIGRLDQQNSIDDNNLIQVNTATYHSSNRKKGKFQQPFYGHFHQSYGQGNQQPNTLSGQSHFGENPVHMKFQQYASTQNANMTSHQSKATPLEASLNVRFARN